MKRRPLGLVEKDQVEVAVIVHLAAAEFAHRQDDQLRDPSGVLLGCNHRLAELGDELGILGGGDPAEAGLGNVRQGGGRRCTSSLPRISRTPTRNCCAFLKLCRIGSRSSAARGQFGSDSLQACRASAACRAPGCPSARRSCPDCSIRMPDKYGLDAHSSTYSRSDGGLKLNSSHSTPLPPSESLTLLRFTSVASGSGVAAMAFKQPRGDRGQKMPAAASREEANLLLRQRHQVLIRLRDVAERVAAEHLGNPRRRRIGVEHQIDLRLRSRSSSPKASCSR